MFTFQKILIYYTGENIFYASKIHEKLPTRTMNPEVPELSTVIIAVMAYVYLLRCADGSLYCGWTNDLERRLAAHNSGKGAKFTRSRRPVELVYCEECESKSAAMKREWQIKQLSRAEKLRLTSQYSHTERFT